MPTERHFQSYAERQIREAMDRGEFDDLPGAGRPFKDLDRSYDAGWWAKRFVGREKLRDVALEIAQQLRRGRLAAESSGRADAAEGLQDLERQLEEINAQLPPKLRVQV